GLLVDVGACGGGAGAAGAGRQPARRLAARGPQPQARDVSGSLLSVAGLTVHYAGRSGGRDRALVAVDGASFDLAAGEIIGLVGESGAGKSTVAYALMRLIDPPGRIVAGSATFEGRGLLALDEAAVRRGRGNRSCLVFQGPAAALNPLMRVGDHIPEGVLGPRRPGGPPPR